MNDKLPVRRRIDVACQRAAAGKRATREIRTWLTDADVGEIDFRLLWLLRETGRDVVPQNQLAAHLVVSTGQVSATVERLQRQQLIVRSAGEGDRRRQCWQLTPRGRRLLDAIVERVAALEKTQPREAA